MRFDGGLERTTDVAERSPRLRGRTVRGARAHRLRRIHPKSHARAQALVEFALVIPLFLILMTAVIEFAFLFNALLSSTLASRDASLIAAEAGDTPGGDCVILRAVEADITAPADTNQIQSVSISWANTTTGQPIAGAVNTYTRTGSTTCSVDGKSITVPYTLSGSGGYDSADRCNVLAGCGLDSASRNHPGVDTIGVQVTYAYPWHTPLKSLMGSTLNWIFTPSNAMRMEPVL